MSEEVSPSGDVRSALDELEALEEDEGRRWGMLVRVAKRTETLLRRPKVNSAMTRVAEMLLDVGTLEGDPLDALMIDDLAEDLLSENRRAFRQRVRTA
jgi:hypothetical protein